jgi:vanillate monooxygenase
MFLKNGWYVAAWDSEIGETPLARTICGEPVMFFRGANGKVVALEDRC